MRDLNHGAKDHLRPIFAAMRPAGASATEIFEGVILVVTVPVPRVPAPEHKTEGRE